MGVRLVIHNFFHGDSSSGAGSGTLNHDELLHRDWVDQHPIYAITGLQEVLNTIEENLINITDLITNQETDLKSYADTQISDAVNIINTTINDLSEVVDELNIISSVKDTDTVDLDYNDETKILKANIKIYNDPNDQNAITVSEDGGLFVQKFNTIDTDSITWDTVSNGETIKELFDDGIKFSHKTSYGYNNLAIPEDLEDWTYDETNDSLNKVDKLNSYNGFVSQGLYDNFRISACIYSSSYAGNSNAIVIAFVFDEDDKPHTLSITFDKGSGSTPQFGIVYNLNLPNQELICQTSLNHTGGWANCVNGVSCYATKDGNLITVNATNWFTNNTNTSIDDAASMTFLKTFSINLNNYYWGHYFSKKVRYGIGSVNQPNSRFDKLFFYSTNKSTADRIRANLKIHNDETNAIEIFNDGAYVKQFKISNLPNNIIEEKPDGYYAQKQLMGVSETRLNGLSDEGNGFYYVHKSHSYVSVNQNNHGLEFGDFIFFDSETNKYSKASAIDNKNINVVGMVDYVYNNNRFEYICNGLVETDIFDTAHGFTQGLPLYLSETEAGKVTQEQPDISKTVGYPIENIGVIINIERGVEYNSSAALGDFKISANNFNIRSDGFIKVEENIDYKDIFFEELLYSLPQSFKDRYIVVNDDTINFINTEELYQAHNVPEGFNLFIRAFDLEYVGTGTLEELRRQNALLREEIDEISDVFDIINREVIDDSAPVPVPYNPEDEDNNS